MRPAALLLAIGTLPLLAQDAPWPTLHRDGARSAFTAEVVKGPYERKWFRDFHDEMIATRVEAILAEGKAFVPTFAGSLHALNVADGATAWTFSAGAAIGSSPLYHGGKLYVGDDAGRLHCLDAASGKPLWAYDAGASIWASPATDGRRVYVGDRAGVFHAVDLATGHWSWSFRTGHMILAPASVYAPDPAREERERGAGPADPRIVVASEDMHVYCLSPEGKLLWKSAKLGGLSCRDYAPTVWRGLAIVMTNPAAPFHRTPGQNPAILTKAQKALPLEPDDKVIHDKWGGYTMKPTPRRIAAEQEAILAHLRENRVHQTCYALNLSDGKEPFIPGVLYTGGLHNTHTPPTFDPATGRLYLWTASALSNYHVGVPGGACTVATLDRATGRTTPLYHANGDRIGWAFDFVAPSDETQALSLMDGILINTHQGLVGGLRLDTLKWHRVYVARDTYGGIFGPAAVPGSFKGAETAHAAGQLALMANEWHGPARGIVSIGYGRFFWVAGSQVVCLGGPDTPRTDTGGSKPPPPILRKHKPVTPGGNVAAGGVGSFDNAVPKPVITPEQVRKYLAAPAPAPSTLPEDVRRALRERLGREVAEVLEREWAPLVIELGISGEERYFWRTSQTMQVLAQALPHLSDELRAKAIARLNAMWDAGMPLDKPAHENTEHRREAYDLGPEMRAFAAATPKYQATVEDLYAVWAYARYAGAWDKVQARLPDIRRLVDAHLAKPPAFDHDDAKATDAAEHLNVQVAGLIAAARIYAKAGRAQDAEKLLARLAELASLRVHHELADTRFVRPTKTASHQLHQAKIPRYLGLTPEVGAILKDLSGGGAARNLANLSRDLPVWHHGWGERLIGGENYISPPHLADSLFVGTAWCAPVPSPQLAGRLDQPWCKADLYHVEKLTALLAR